MKRNCFVLTGLIVGCILFLQIGCQKPAAEPPKTVCEGGVCRIVPEHKTEPAAPIEPATGTTKTRTTEPKAKKKGPKITFEKLIQDFGGVGSQTRHTCQFKFTNTGDSLLRIKRIRHSCTGCTVAELSKKKYAPGESGTLKVTYRAGTRRGSEKKYVYIDSNDKTKPKVTLTIKAKIVPKVAHEPKELKLLLNKENAGCPKITLRSLDNKPFAITQFKSSADCITADYNPSVKKTKFVLEPKVDIEKLEKGLNGHINISLTHPACRRVTIRFETLPKFAIDPPLITILGCEPQKPVTRDVWILNNYGEDFEIESVSSKEGIIRVLSRERIDSRYKFILEITPPIAKDKMRFFTDVLFVNIDGGEKLEVSCAGFYSTPPKKSQADKS